jgi:glutamate dehydrogenase
VDRATTWFLRAGGRPLDIGFHSKAYAAPIAELAAHLEDVLPEAEAKQLAEKAERFVAQGVHEGLAKTVAALAPWLAPALDAVRIARDRGLDPLKVAQLYFIVGERFGFVRLREAAAKLPTDKAWDKLAVSAVMDDLYSYQGAATARVLATSGDGVPAETAVEEWAEKRRPVLARAEELLAELKTTATPELAMLAVANQQLKALGA